MRGFVLLSNKQLAVWLQAVENGGSSCNSKASQYQRHKSLLRMLADAIQSSLRDDRERLHPGRKVHAGWELGEVKSVGRT